jgi:hypothetical protein
LGANRAKRGNPSCARFGSVFRQPASRDNQVRIDR